MIKIPMAKPYVGLEEANAVHKKILEGWLSMGQTVLDFEKEFAKMVGAKYAVATNNGTTALHIALIASGIKDGDEVLVPDITFASTAKVVLYERATPILLPCDSKTFNLSIEHLEKFITPKTKAIILVDMNGMPVDYDKIQSIAEKHNLFVIADSAESMGSEYKDKKIGAIAPMHVFSFFPNKNITTGEGGIITTNNEKLYEQLKELRNMGQDYRYHHTSLGFNYRMTEIAAAIGLEQLKKFDFIMASKQKIVETYNKQLKGVDGINLPFIPGYVTQHAWYMYTITFKSNIDRDYVAKKLLDDYGIETRMSFPPIHSQPFFKKKYSKVSHLILNNKVIWDSLLNLPIWVGLTVEDQAYITDAIKNIIKDF